MTIRFQDGRREAVMLASGRDRMRIVTRSKRDAIELHKVDTHWVTEDGDEVEIETMTPLAGIDVSDFCSELWPRTAETSGATG